MESSRSSSKKPRKNSSYHLLVVPEDSSQIHRVRVRLWQLRGAVLLVIGLVLGLAVTSGGYIRYQKLYRKTASIRASYGELQEEQARLAQRLVQLEETVLRTESLAHKVDALITPKDSDGTQALGPVETFERPPRGDMKKFAMLNRLEPKSFTESFDVMFERLLDRSHQAETKVTSLYQEYQDRTVRLSSTPGLWPVRGWTTSGFGLRRSPFTKRAKFHHGLDIAASWGHSVKSSAAGIVSFAGYKGGYGKTIIVDHGFGVKTFYGHNSKLLAQVGDKVTRGMKIAAVGNTGHSTGPHLHFEIHVDGVPVDPMNYLPARLERRRGATTAKAATPNRGVL